jgi:ArsR family transcriptional regulator, arsenate/arsenite/antimonite-responsive transcriptional repressor
MGTRTARSSQPLPIVSATPPVATPHVVAKPRNLTIEAFQALSDPLRLQLLAVIAARGPICVCHLQEALAYSQPRISKHLATLRRAGLVSSRREGTWVYYQTSAEMLTAARDFLDQLEASMRRPHATDRCPDPE